MENFAIKTDNLTKKFNNIDAVDNVSFNVPQGIIFGFLGPNGSGKTTTINLLLGLLEPTSGKAEVLGFDTRTRSDEIRSRSGVVLEHSGLYERLSAEDNLEFYGRVYRMPAGERKERIRELLTHMDLWERRKGPVGKWSKGMKQRLAISRALLHHPSIIFLDEPTSGLDPVIASSLREDLRSVVAREGVTIFLNTHNLAEAEKLCKRVGIINKGKLITVTDPDELRSRSLKPRAEIIGSAFTRDIGSLLRALPGVSSVDLNENRILVDISENVDIPSMVDLIVRSGGRVEEVHKVKASLEDAFLSLLEAGKC